MGHFSSVFKWPFRRFKIESRRYRPRAAYSLIELILATAVLAASGLALQTLLAQGVKLASRAEDKTLAIQLAESLIDEVQAMPPSIDREQESTFEHDSSWSYRLRWDVIENRGLTRMTVEVLPTRQAGSLNKSSESRATCRLVRWIRTPLPAPKSQLTNSRASSRGPR